MPLLFIPFFNFSNTNVTKTYMETIIIINIILLTLLYFELQSKYYKFLTILYNCSLFYLFNSEYIFISQPFIEISIFFIFISLILIHHLNSNILLF